MSEAAATSVALAHPIAPEEQARADVYAVLGRLFAGPPDGALLQAIANAPALGVPTLLDEDDTAARFSIAWDRLRRASAAMDADAAKQEYDDLFVGVGKSEVNLHASHWLTGFMMEKPLVEVRATLAGLDLARRPTTSLVEDHAGALFETMRLLVAGFGDRPPAPLSEQQLFFQQHIAPWIDRCCGAIMSHTLANYYARVAELAKYFVALERDSFAIGID